MRKVIAASVTAWVLACTACHTDDAAKQAHQNEAASRQLSQLTETLKAHEEWKKQHAAQLAQPPPRTISDDSTAQNEVRIGMKSSKVRELCGRPDDNSLTESTRGSELVLWYKYDKDKAEKGCWGTMLFDYDFKLIVHRMD